MKPTPLNAAIMLSVVTAIFLTPVLLTRYVWVHLWWSCIPCSLLLVGFILWARHKQ